MEWLPFDESPHSYPYSRPHTPIPPTFEEDITITFTNTSLEDAPTAEPFPWDNDLALFRHPAHGTNLDIPALSDFHSQLLRPANLDPTSNGLLITSGNFISDVNDLDRFQFREDGFSPTIARPGSQGSRSPHQRHRHSRRPSHSATSVTTNQPGHCPCPFEDCKTEREHMSHIVHHLTQKHGFRRVYLNSVQGTTTKRKKECVVVNYEQEYAFCNWCWTNLQTRESIDQHINQSSRCPNRQNYSKDQKQLILRAMLDGSISQSSQLMPSEASQSIADWATAPSDFGSIGRHFKFGDDSSQFPNHPHDGSTHMPSHHSFTGPDPDNQFFNPSAGGDDNPIPEVSGIIFPYSE